MTVLVVAAILFNVPCSMFSIPQQGDAEISIKIMYFLNAITNTIQKKIQLQGHLHKLVFEGPLQANLVMFSCCKWH